MAKRRILEVPSAKRQTEFLLAAARSRTLHEPWVSPPRTEAAFIRYLDRLRLPNYAGFWVLTPSRELAGVITLSEIVRGNFRSAYLGYYAFVPHNSQGHLTDGLRAVVSHAFKRLDLHRLEANIQPGNHASRALVQRLGFRHEGLSPRYLRIGGEWRDHERWAITAEEWGQVLP
jgi:ribosomal-protein-alanine N-acetyltransferase